MRMHCAAMPARGHDHILNHPHEYPRERLPVFGGPYRSPLLIHVTCLPLPVATTRHVSYRSSLERHPPARPHSTPRALDAGSGIAIIPSQGRLHHDVVKRTARGDKLRRRERPVLESFPFFPTRGVGLRRDDGEA